MRERVKTILLFSLVLLGVFLTQKLWIQLPGRVFSVFQDKEVPSASYLLSDMIAPNKYLLNFDQHKHNVVYEDKYNFWDNAMINLKYLLGSETIKIDQITTKQYIDLKEQRSLVCFFPEKVNTYILAKAWEVNDPNSITDTIPNITDIYIFLGNGNPFFVFSNNETHIAIYDEGIDTNYLKEQLAGIEDSDNFDRYYPLKEVLGIDKDIFVPLEIKNTLPVVYVTNEIATLDSQEKDLLAERYFSVSVDKTREIVEANGSSIYVYNNRFLKLNVNGTLEYFHPIEEEVLERNLYISLSNAANFITKKSGTQQGMYLAKVEKIEADNNLGYRFTFRYRIRGIPLILGNDEVREYIQMEVFNNHIRNYKHFARREIEISFPRNIDGRKMLASYDVIDKNIDFLVRRYLESNNLTIEQVEENIYQEVVSSIQDITLSYYDPCLKDKDERLIGVWAIRIDERLYAFDAYTGTLVFER